MKIISQTNLQDAAQILRRGGLVAFPTETVFGLGVIYDNRSSYSRLVHVKRRPPEKPFTLMCASIDDIERFAEVDEHSRKLIKAFMPGQFTIVLPARRTVPSWAVSKEGMVGIRVPNYPLVQELIELVGRPLLVPSANRSGETPYTNSQDVYWGFVDEIDAVIEGNSTSNVPSTVVVMGENIEIAREGQVTYEMILKALEE